MNNWTFPALIAWAIATNGVWYACKVVLRNKGYSVSWFWSHWRDLPNMRQLVATEDLPVRRWYYRTLLFSLYACLACTPIMVLLLLFWGR